MSPGKAGAQAGHAFTDALLNGLALGDAASARYAALRPGTKVLLGAPLWRLNEWVGIARLHAIPHAFIIDSGHVEAPDFDGSPVPTALGLGPFDAERPMPLELARALRAARPWPPKCGQDPRPTAQQENKP
jgi:PTH2 family peptidyl-tRNA hydrolase